MNIIMRDLAGEWNRSYNLVEEQIHSFNTTIKIADSFEKLEAICQTQKLKEIQSVVKRETKNLKELSLKSEERLANFNSPGWRKSYTHLLETTVPSSLLTKGIMFIGGLAIHNFSNSLVVQALATSALCSAFLVDAGLSAYSQLVLFVNKEKSKLETIDKQDLDEAKNFKRLIKSLKQIKKVERAEALDLAISTCLEHYKKLRTPEDDVYFRLLSILLNHLPKDDPLKKNLEELPTLYSLDSKKEYIETLKNCKACAAKRFGIQQEILSFEQAGIDLPFSSAENISQPSEIALNINPY